ncbi:RNA polymerase sigma24 factor [Actinorhabdospora filicis]|uniref:RNA polymerase sigma24 factor n=1 Tax=Actinorhabdospora filicis TaxID=1785913 RepID=A0A9W6WCY3_9ACTN|nr:sigma factor-like helix-turn-helix DNA-binding protein [Actinorhabdospora filicis]GLZ81051.1 RNA polymerase sigma24 factor [Actinorhabdospora filicis]
MTPEQDRDYRDYVVAHTRRLCRFAYLCCADWRRAEDVVQTALVRLYASWNRARRTTPDVYVRRLIVAALIGERGFLRLRREPIPDVPPEPGDEPVLISALLRLPKRQRAAVVLRFWEGLPAERAASVLGCSTGAAENLAERGVAALRGLLADPSLVIAEGATS